MNTMDSIREVMDSTRKDLQERWDKMIKTRKATHTAIREKLEEIMQGLCIPGVESFTLCPAASHEYIMMKDEIWRWRARPQHVRRNVPCDTPVWIAKLKSGAIVVQCPNRAIPPTEIDRYVVCFGSKYVQRDMPCSYTMLQEEAKGDFPELGAALLPEMHDRDPMQDKELKQAYIFYKHCPRETLLAIRSAFWIAKQVVFATVDTSPIYDDPTVFDVVQQRYETLPPPVKYNREHGTYVVDDTRITQDNVSQDVFTNYVYQKYASICCDAQPTMSEPREPP